MTTLLDPQTKISASPHVLSAIRAENCNLAVWQRTSVAGLDALELDRIKDIRFASSVGELERALEAQCEQAGYAPGNVRTALVRDIANLADHFAAIMELGAIQVRLAIVTTNSCRKFHADYVKARLITTYIGTGTQWIEDQDLAGDTNGEEPRRINALSAGDVGLFKGKMWTQTPAIHRSPPIEGTDETRLMLVLDPVREG